MSLTKEEILDKIAIRHKDSEPGTFIISRRNKTLEAMDEYALQEMGKFAEWASLNSWKVGTNGVWFSLEEDNFNEYTTDELIQRYLNRQLP